MLNLDYVICARIFCSLKLDVCFELRLLTSILSCQCLAWTTTHLIVPYSGLGWLFQTLTWSQHTINYFCFTIAKHSGYPFALVVARDANGFEFEEILGLKRIFVFNTYESFHITSFCFFFPSHMQYSVTYSSETCTRVLFCGVSYYLFLKKSKFLSITVNESSNRVQRFKL